VQFELSTPHWQLDIGTVSQQRKGNIKGREGRQGKRDKESNERKLQNIAKINSWWRPKQN